jgi:hypothetical protein
MDKRKLTDYIKLGPISVTRGQGVNLSIKKKIYSTLMAEQLILVTINTNEVIDLE